MDSVLIETDSQLLETIRTLRYDYSMIQVDDKTRVLLYAIRQALLMLLGALEDFMEIERSVIPKHKR